MLMNKPYDTSLLTIQINSMAQAHQNPELIWISLSHLRYDLYKLFSKGGGNLSLDMKIASIKILISECRHRRSEVRLAYIEGHEHSKHTYSLAKLKPYLVNRLNS